MQNRKHLAWALAVVAVAAVGCASSNDSVSGKDAATLSDKLSKPVTQAGSPPAGAQPHMPNPGKPKGSVTE